MTDLPQVRLHEIGQEGLRMPILECASRGMKPGQIEEYLKKHHRVFIDKRTVGHFLKQLGDDRNEIMQAGMMHELRELQRISRKRLHHFLTRYEESEGEDRREEMEFYEDCIRDWWSKNRGFFNDFGDLNIFLQQNDFSSTQNSVQILVDELSKEDPSRAEEVLDRMRENGR